MHVTANVSPSPCAQRIRYHVPATREAKYSRLRIIYLGAILGLDDIPAQIGRVVQFSVRNKTSFVLSYVTAVFAIGFAADLIYSFVYTAITNSKDAHYGTAAWLVLGFSAFGILLIAGLCAGLQAWKNVRPFSGKKYGVAIAPFDVFSIDPDVLGTPSKKQGLENAVAQFFSAVLARLREKAWYDDFEFRSLPPFVRVAIKPKRTLDVRL